MRFLIVYHDTRSEEIMREMERFSTLVSRISGASIETCQIGELGEKLEILVEEGGEIVVIPLLIFRGKHYSEIERICEEKSKDNLRIRILEPLADWFEIASAIGERLRNILLLG